MSDVGFVLSGTDQVAYPGTVLVTASGRDTSPFPRIDLTSQERANATMRRFHVWLLDEANAELDYRQVPSTVRAETGVDAEDPNAGLSFATQQMLAGILFDAAFFEQVG